MKEKKRGGLMTMGGSSLLTAFAMLCLAAFAMLSLSTVQAEKRLSDTAARATEAYYAADLEAERIFARLRAGDEVPGVAEENGVYGYYCRISSHQALLVEVTQEGGEWKVLRWQSKAYDEEKDGTLPVWTGR